MREEGLCSSGKLEEFALGLPSQRYVAAGIPLNSGRRPRAPRFRGTVQDPQGGVLPGVTVTLTSNTQGNVLTAVTDDSRAFRVPHRPSRHLLAPGHAPGLQDARADEPSS